MKQIISFRGFKIKVQKRENEMRINRICPSPVIFSGKKNNGKTPSKKQREESIDYFIKNIPEELNKESKERVLNNFDTDKFAKVVTHYAFRNGPVEDMHANGQLSENDMKTLNKYMTNRIAGILELIKQGQWFKIETLLEMNKYYGTNWDKAEPDAEEVDRFLKCILKP